MAGKNGWQKKIDCNSLSSSTEGDWRSRAQANGRVSDDWYVLDLRHTLRIIVFYLEYSYCRLGDSMIRSKSGTVQGSPLAPSLCCLVLSLSEHYTLSGVLGMSKKWYCAAFRWIDDIFLLCVHFTKKTVSPLIVTDTNAIFEAKFESLIAAYKGTELPMKRKCEKIFVGLDVRWDALCVKIGVRMHVGFKPGKFINWWSYGQKQRKIQFFQGMLVAALDRTLGTGPSPAVRGLIWRFYASGFLTDSYAKAKAILCKKRGNTGDAICSVGMYGFGLA